MENKKVLIFRQQLFKPSETFIASQAESLKEYVPIYVGRKLFGDSPVNSQKILLANQSLYAQAKYAITRIPKKYKELEKINNVKLIHAHFAIDGVYALPLAKKLNVPLIVTLHGFDVTRTTKDMLLEFKPSFYNYAIYRKELLKSVEKFICVSEFIKQKAIAAGFPADKLITHYIGIDIHKFKFRENIINNNTILHVARLVEKKGTTYLLKALKQIKEKIPSVKLVIIGDGPLRENLEKEIVSLNLENNVEFLGVQPNSVVKEWLYKSSVMCVPSIVASNGDAEGLGIVNLEAGAIGVPVVAFASGGIVEAIIDNVTGFLVKEKKIEDLAEKLIRLLTDIELNQKMGRNARQFIEKTHNQVKQNVELEKIYDHLVALKK